MCTSEPTGDPSKQGGDSNRIRLSAATVQYGASARNLPGMNDADGGFALHIPESSATRRCP
jgi:hypothetical protein